MGKKRDDQDFEDIAQLIREDEEQALRIFRQRNFDKKIRARIAGASKRNRSFFGQWTVVSASVAGLLLIALGSIFLFTRRSSSGSQGGPAPMAVVLKDLPGISDLITPRGTISAEAIDAFGPARTFRVILAMVTQRIRDEERKATVPTGHVSVPRLSLEKKMEILFKDRAIERVLVRMIKKSEEV